MSTPRSTVCSPEFFNNTILICNKKDIKNNHPEKRLFKFIDTHTTQLAHHPKDYRDKTAGTDTSVRAKMSLVMTSGGEALDQANPMKMFLMGMYDTLEGWELWWFWDRVHAEINSF